MYVMFFQLKINIRNLRRSGIYSIVNICDLAIGMTVAIIMLWGYHQGVTTGFMPKTVRKSV